jgi:hypothetical protein
MKRIKWDEYGLLSFISFISLREKYKNGTVFGAGGRGDARDSSAPQAGKDR